MTEIKVLDSIIFLTENIELQLKDIVKNYPAGKIFVLADSNTNTKCFEIISNSFEQKPHIVVIKSGEAEKNIDTAMDIWNFLSKNGCERSSLLINLGGGVITDLGGFVASSFKRGIDFVNIPTTLLAQIDAAIGGKTGINLNNLKNEVGFFNSPKFTIIDPAFLSTLDRKQIISGFAEMLKHALIYSQTAWENIKGFDLKNINIKFINILLEESILIKKHFIEKDPLESGIREALNLGHTFGHAIETFFLNKGIDILHGEAVAMGLICELFLSNKVMKLELKKMLEVIGFIIDNFQYYEINPKDYDEIFELMKHDKKNTDNKIKMTLISDIGKVEIKQYCSTGDIYQALGFYFQIMR